jgi:SnoaL-like domain
MINRHHKALAGRREQKTMNENYRLMDVLLAKEEIRELVMLYSRGCDRKDIELLRTLYTSDATDSHDRTFDGPANQYIDFLERSLPHLRYSGHHVCHHLISVDPQRGEGEGEVYALAWHVYPDRQGGLVEDFMCVRYIDRYRKDNDRWRFAKRVVRYDLHTARPHQPTGEAPDAGIDPSYSQLASRLFAKGARA